MRRYLPKADKARLEEHYFLDADALRRLEMAEEDLIDDYLAQQLGPDDKQRFEQFFLSTRERRSKLRFAKTLNQRTWRNATLSERLARRLRVSHTALLRLGGPGSPLRWFSTWAWAGSCIQKLEKRSDCSPFRA